MGFFSFVVFIYFVGCFMSSAVFVGRYVAVAVRDYVLPPLSSKVVKYVVESSGCGLSKFGGGFMKPLSISMLFLDGRPLYSYVGLGGFTPVSVVGGSVLTFRISLVGSLNDVDVNVFKSIEGLWNTPYGVFDIYLKELEVLHLSSLGLGLSRFFKVSFITPTVLTSKYMLPPTLKSRSSELPERHRLLPQPSFILSYLLRLWNSVASPEERVPHQSAGDWEAYKLGRLADVTITEVNYSLRPTTAVIGRDDKGRLRIVRGFTGWVIYECLNNKLLKTYDKLLALANYLGVGRSRGVGLGMVSVDNVEERTRNSAKTQL